MAATSLLEAVGAAPGSGWTVAGEADAGPQKTIGSVVEASEKRDPDVERGCHRVRYVPDRISRVRRHRVNRKRQTGESLAMEPSVRKQGRRQLNNRHDLAMYSAGAYGRALTESAVLAAALYALALLEEYDGVDVPEDLLALKAARLALTDLLQ